MNHYEPKIVSFPKTLLIYDFSRHVHNNRHMLELINESMKLMIDRHDLALTYEQKKIAKGVLGELCEVIQKVYELTLSLDRMNSFGAGVIEE